jgi:hypothetical protein
MTNNEHEPLPFSRDRLERLSAFLPQLRDSKATFGRWRGGDAVAGNENIRTMPYFEPGDWAMRFTDMLYQSGWILEGFDWMQWAQTPEGQSLISNKDAIATADEKQMARLLTALVREDRFSEGALASAFDKGLLLAIAERAQRLMQEH